MTKKDGAKADVENDAKAKAKGPGTIVRDLHDLCTATLARSIDTGFDALNSESYGWRLDLDCWVKVLNPEPNKHCMLLRRVNTSSRF